FSYSFSVVIHPYSSPEITILPFETVKTPLGSWFFPVVRRKVYQPSRFFPLNNTSFFWANACVPLPKTNKKVNKNDAVRINEIFMVLWLKDYCGIRIGLFF